MPGKYEDTGGPPLQATLLTDLNGSGSPIGLQSILNFENIPMGYQVGGDVAGSQFPGYWTGMRTDCVVVAVMQLNTAGGWARFFFAHLQGGMWTPTDRMLFKQTITDPANAYIAMNSNAFAGMEVLLNEMNQGNPNGHIPASHLLKYKSPNPTFALRLANGGIGQVP